MCKDVGIDLKTDIAVTFRPSHLVQEIVQDIDKDLKPYERYHPMVRDLGFQAHEQKYR